MNKIVVILVLTLTAVVFIGGCGQSEQEKYYEQLNDNQKKAETINKEAADSLLKMKKAPLYDNPENNPASNSNTKKK